MDYSSSYEYNNDVVKKNNGLIAMLKKQAITVFWIVFVISVAYYGVHILRQFVEIRSMKAEQQVYLQKISELDSEINSLQLQIQKAQNIDEIRYRASTELNMIKRNEKEAISMKENVNIATGSHAQEKQLDEFSFVAAMRSIFNR